VLQFFSHLGSSVSSLANLGGDSGDSGDSGRSSSCSSSGELDPWEGAFDGHPAESKRPLLRRPERHWGHDLDLLGSGGGGGGGGGDGFGASSGESDSESESGMMFQLDDLHFDVGRAVGGAVEGIDAAASAAAAAATQNLSGWFDVVSTALGVEN
jgi:hypothetical protein